MMRNNLRAALTAIAAATAYIGPGAGIGAIGSLIAVVSAGVLTLIGLVWYPVRQLLRFRRSRREDDARE